MHRPSLGKSGKDCAAGAGGLPEGPIEADPAAFNIKDSVHDSRRRSAAETGLRPLRHTVPSVLLTGWKSGSDTREHSLMEKQQRQDAMKAVDHATWLIVQDQMNELISHIKLAPLTDLPEILSITMEQLRTRGWRIEVAPRLSSVGFFCHRDGERWFVHIVHYDPARQPRGRPAHSTH
jgi:hypothetical protein